MSDEEKASDIFLMIPSHIEYSAWLAFPQSLSLPPTGP